MEEKERYKYYEKTNQIYDKINDELYCLGIEQDKIKLVSFLNLVDEDWWTLYERNKELRRENEQLREQLNNTDFYREYCRLKSSSDDLIKGLTEQCQQLKSQPLEIVEKIKKELEMNGDSYCEIRECNSPYTNHQYAWFNYVRFREVIDTMLKEYQEEYK